MNGIRILALFALGGLSACGGGGGDGSAPLTGFELQDAEAAALLGDTLAAGPVLAVDMPTAGSATYEGFMALNAPGSAAGSAQQAFDNPAMLGDLTMEASFTNKTLSGQADNFHTADGDDVGGSLALEGGTISLADFRVGLNGTLDQDGTETAYSGEVSGRFYGTRADALLGSVDSFATTDEGTVRVRGGVVAD